MVLARITNSIRFSVGAAFDRHGDPAPASNRQRIGSFLYLGALLYEALRFADRLGEHFRDHETFRIDFVPLLNDQRVQDLREGVLKRLRNRAIYHHDDDVMPEGLRDLVMPEYVFARGHGTGFMDLDYILPDILISKFALPELDVTRALTDQLAPVLRDVLMVGQRFALAADRLIDESTRKWGWKVTSEF
ncbi:MAG: hypothetical protein WEA80_04955 [Gemmatimonadaceae bacterium]